LNIGKKFQSDLVVLVSVLAYTISLSLFTIVKHYSFSTYAWDLGIFNQGFWTTCARVDVFANRTILNPVTFRENELKNDTLTNLGFNFTLPDVVYDLEFRGFLDRVNTSIRLDSIHLTQKT
jgi:hypothetical protein